MSKIKGHLEEIHMSEEYQFGWASAERGEPPPPNDNEWQHLGWCDYHDNPEETL
jgi:hypothetical protein